VGTKVSRGLGGLLFLEDYETGKRRGTLTWSGLPNLLWTIDREAGLCAMYPVNVVPLGDLSPVIFRPSLKGRCMRV
jgi:hypothetical protein